MTIVKRTPFTELDPFEHRMRRFFEEFGLKTPALLPAADIYETGDAYVVELEVPGFDDKELEIEASDHTLTVKGRRTTTADDKAKAFALHERLEREFERRFVLPVEVDTEKLTATFEKGVLKLHAPKPKTAMPKKIEIRKA